MVILAANNDKLKTLAKDSLVHNRLQFTRDPCPKSYWLQRIMYRDGREWVTYYIRAEDNFHFYASNTSFRTYWYTRIQMRNVLNLTQHITNLIN